MKNIRIFSNEKYNNQQYKKVKDGIYKYKAEDGQKYFCTAISFEQEPEYEEGENSAIISQYPLEDILDKFNVYVSDFFKELNNGESNICYYEFSGAKKKYVVNLKKSIVGKHVYNKETEDSVELIIE